MVGNSLEEETLLQGSQLAPAKESPNYWLYNLELKTL